jgi:hypothetical protein
MSASLSERNLRLIDHAAIPPARAKALKPVIERSSSSSREEPALFSIDWLRGAIPVEKEICVLATKDEAITAAKSRAPDVAKRHSGAFG